MSQLPRRTAAMLAWSPIMIRGAAVCVALLAVALLGLIVDPRVITNAPAWLKPAKFSVSGAVYLATLAFMVKDMPRRRLLRVATFLISTIIVLETILIFVQAARGTTSHFNADTPLDLAIFSSMGLGIATVWIMSGVLLVLHLRAPATDRAMATALRLGLVLNILGAGVGWRMTQPSAEQTASLSKGAHPMILGAHTVGAPDGGPSIPVIRWSATHGDLRIPHFLGMHSLQLLPLLLLGLRRVRTVRDDSTERSTVVLAASVCAGIFGAALVQALNGQPLIHLAGS
jgi:hypothetical protein